MVKRSIDILISGLTLILAAPVAVIVSLAVLASLGRPVLYRQERPGLDAKPFVLLKFRTMTNAKDRDGNSLPDAERLTRVGALLRKTSLDEIPQLWNILRGEMSLVGPRPLLMRYLPYFTRVEMRRHSVRPGITGLAQVTGRNTLGWDERLALDVEYVDRQSTWLDVRIIWWTIGKVLRRADIAVDPTSNMLDLDEERRRAGETRNP